jgi:hypothetical protein
MNGATVISDAGFWKLKRASTPSIERYTSFSLISVDWRVCPTSRGLGKMLGVRRYAVVVDVMVVKGTGGY